MLIFEGGGEGKFRELVKLVISDGFCKEESIDYIMVSSYMWVVILCYIIL